jgi:hypothetical protein
LQQKKLGLRTELFLFKLARNSLPYHPIGQPVADERPAVTESSNPAMSNESYRNFPHAL